MTLVMARKFSNRIVVVSDTMISGADLARSDIIPGCLKTIVVDDALSISFSGTVDAAVATIRQARLHFSKQKDLIGLISFLKERSTFDDCNFIISSHVGPPTIYKIWDGSVASGENSYWIGDVTAANKVSNRLQTAEKTPIEGDLDPEFGDYEEREFVSALGNLAFKGGIRFSTGVGGILVTQLGSPNGYTYLSFAGTVIHDAFDLFKGETEEQLANQASVMTQYSYNVVLPRHRGAAVIGIFFPQPKGGFVYCPITCDKPNKFENTTLATISKQVEIRAQEVGGWISPDESPNNIRSSAIEKNTNIHAMSIDGLQVWSPTPLAGR